MSENHKSGLLRGSRSPGSIQNAEFHDASSAERSLNGSAATIDFIIANSSIASPVLDDVVIRVVNTSASIQYLFVGQESLLPVGTPDITNGLALPIGQAEIIFTGRTNTAKESIMLKSSSSSVQIAVMV